MACRSLVRFLLVANRKGRLGELEAISEAYAKLLNERFGKVEVDVFTVDPTNPLYGGSPEAEPDSDAQAAMAATVVVAGADKMRDTWTLPGDIGQLASGSEPTIALDLNKIDQGGEAPAAKVDSELDFDLDLQSSEPVAEAPAVGVATTMTKPGEESDADSSP